MVWLKKCARCRGDLALSYDLDGPFIGCIQCGAELSKQDGQALVRSSLNAWRKQGRPRPPAAIERWVAEPARA